MAAGAGAIVMPRLIEQIQRFAARLDGTERGSRLVDGFEDVGRGELAKCGRSQGGKNEKSERARRE